MPKFTVKYVVTHSALVEAPSAALVEVAGEAVAAALFATAGLVDAEGNPHHPNLIP